MNTGFAGESGSFLDQRGVKSGLLIGAITAFVLWFQQPNIVYDKPSKKYKWMMLVILTLAAAAAGYFLLPDLL